MSHTNQSSHHSSLAIGVFDSGVGGLSVYRHLKQALPHEQFIYYADTKNVPYGNKSSDDIIALTCTAVDWLIAQGVKLIVIACNSASAYSLALLRERYCLPIVGLVPAIKPAIAISQSQKIAVLATRATLTGRPFNELVDSLATPKGVIVYRHFEPKLVPWVEMGAPIDHQVADLLITQMHQWAQDGVDTLVLGCTHYPFFRPFLEAEINRTKLAMTVIDSGLAIAERVKSLLHSHCLLNPQTDNPPLHFYSSDDNSRIIVHQLIGDNVYFLNPDNSNDSDVKYTNKPQKQSLKT